MESLFFIDTGGKEDASDPGLSDDNMEEMVEDKVMGAKDAATEAKQRQRAIQVILASHWSILEILAPHWSILLIPGAQSGQLSVRKTQGDF